MNLISQVDQYFEACLVSLQLCRAICLLLGLIVYASAAFSQSSPPQPFHVRNMNPFTLIHGLPVATSSDILGDHVSSLRLQWDVANNSIQSTSEDEQVILDGETNLVSLTWKRGFGLGWEFGIEIPYLTHRGGGLDGFIENWHNLFGFSNSDRDDWSRNQLRYLYTKDGNTEVKINQKVSGFGDLQLLLSRELSLADDNLMASMHLSLKLPTGDEDTLLGSGAPDLSIWLSGSNRKLLQEWPFGGYGQVGVLVMGNSSVLDEEQRKFVLFGTLGSNWWAYDWLELKAQVDAHTSFYRSDARQVGGSAMMFTFGGTIPFDDGSQIDLSIGENMTTDMVPDLIFNIGYKALF
jgi:hypothetical protein